MEAGQKPRGILGHHLVYDEEATQDAKERACAYRPHT